VTEEPASRRRAQELWDAQGRWNAFVAIYDNEEVRDPQRAGEAFWRAGEADARRLGAFFAPGERVLDLGCGMGRVLFFLAPRAGETIGVDISSEMLARARQAFASVPRARFLETKGASLAGVDTGSVDFVYSLLCLIHVDRRSAYRYMEEVRRVLRPDGLAFLQFQNILSAPGLAKFRTVLDGDYPLEFYTEEELRYLLASAGLDLVTGFAEAEYLYLTVIAGDAAAWRARLAAGVRAEALGTEGSGSLKVALRSDLPALRPLRLELSVTRAGRPLRVADAVLDLPPGVSHLAVRRVEPLSAPEAHLDGRPLELRTVHEAPDPGGGPLEFHAALLPPGFLHTARFQAEFPGLACSWPAS
jgi:SAM-dependent methyltransferase